MRIGVPKEIKVHEYRVGMVPAGVRELAAAGHEVLVETRCRRRDRIHGRRTTRPPAPGSPTGRQRSSRGPTSSSR